MVNSEAHWQAINSAYCMDEISCVRQLLPLINLPHRQIRDISSDSRRLITEIRGISSTNTLNELLQEYQLSTDEGLALMCLAEALLRIPDDAVAQQLIRDRIAGGDWHSHLGQDHSLLINASTALLMLSGKVMKKSHTGNYIKKLVRRVTKPVVHQSMLKVVKAIAAQFVFAEHIDQAVEQMQAVEDRRISYSLDMLGEAALSAQDAEAYFASYLQAVERLAASHSDDGNISVKLSALYPRYEVRHHQAAFDALCEKMKLLITAAKRGGVSITIDAEESERLQLSLEIFTALYADDICDGYEGLGLAVQAYTKRALPVLRYLQDLYQQHRRRIPLRLVKGAYWDAEIKQAQLHGLIDYPVFTDKNHTDVSYLACVHYLQQHLTAFYPQFATHNISTIAHILHVFDGSNEYEFQRLHGMGEEIYQCILEKYPALRCRVYGPVGIHKDLLAYLVRRILENGANNSFLKQLMEDRTVDERLAIHPVDLLQDLDSWCSSQVQPQDMYQPQRSNSRTVDLVDELQRQTLMNTVAILRQKPAVAESGVTPEQNSGDTLVSITNPMDGKAIGYCRMAGSSEIDTALDAAEAAFPQWRQKTVEERAECLRNFADLLESSFNEFTAQLILEAGKTVTDAINEVREAVDFARYYANLAEQQFSHPIFLNGAVGEHNSLHWRGRGIFLCISPWNFPLAIFTGQVVAALVSGNCVLAKPAESTPLIAAEVCKLLYQSGIPEPVLHLLTGSGDQIGKAVCSDRRLSGVAFTGSTQTAAVIHQRLAQRGGAIVPLIAETGGQNVMIADSSTLPEQLVKDVIQSAFHSAGQRCSALRVLYIQEDILEPVMALLKGAVEQLQLGDPSLLNTDIGPVISSDAWQALDQHVQAMKEKGKVLFQYAVDTDTGCGQQLFPPTVIGLDSIKELEQEHFGPVLHVIPYAYEAIDECIRDINQCGYGLTLGIHSRNEKWALRMAEKLNVGNIYINKAMTGAVVGVQPFGGLGLSGTGPKAGGPHYLQRFAVEVSISNNVAAMGGNVSLLSGREDS